MIPAPGGQTPGTALIQSHNFLPCGVIVSHISWGMTTLNPSPRTPRGGILDVWQCPDLFGQIGGRAVPCSVICEKHRNSCEPGAIDRFLSHQAEQIRLNLYVVRDARFAEPMYLIVKPANSETKYTVVIN